MAGVTTHHLIQKKKKWQQQATLVERITDRLGKHIDEDIKSSVVALRAQGFSTDGSCEGHSRHGTPYPWIDIYAPEPTGELDAEEKEKIWQADNARQRKRLQKLLCAFYQQHLPEDHDAIFLLNPIGIFGGFRLQSRGATSLDLLPSHIRRKKRERYRAEFDDFTRFLRARYFEGRRYCLFPV
jgi:hypothetical protein